MFDEYPLRTGDSVVPWVLSAASERELAARARTLADDLADRPHARPTDVGAALADADTARPHRAVICGTSPEQLRDGLDAVATGAPHADVVRGTVARRSRVAFVYPGQGGQWPGMTLDLVAESPVYRRALSECASAFADFGGPDLEAFLRRPAGSAELRRPDLVQPALFAIEASLSAVWGSFGVVPDAVIGHSMGDVAAAHVAGATDLADAARVIAQWSERMMPLVGHGDMASVALPVEEVRRRSAEWADGTTVAGVLGPRSVLLAGEPASIARRVEELVADDVTARVIDVGMAAHSPLTAPVHAPTVTALDWFAPGPGAIPFYSSYTGGRLDTTELTGRYWADNFRHPVRLDNAVRSCAEAGAEVFVEVSPQPVLAAGVEQTVEDVARGAVVLHTLRRRHGDLHRFLLALAHAYAAGVAVDWTAAFPAGAGRFALPEVELAESAGPATRSPAGRHEVERLVLGEATAVLGRTEPVDPATPFVDAGFDSALAVELVTRLRTTLDPELSVAALYDHPTPRELAAALSGAAGAGTATESLRERGPVPHEPVAVVGMACRLPSGVDSPEDFWELLADGRDGVGELPRDRGWDLAALLQGDRGRTSTQRAGGFLNGATDFDPEFFRMSPREALAADPQQRLLLEVSWEALERARIAPTSLRGSRTGVFTGVIGQEYGPRLAGAADETSGYRFTGTTPSVASGRVAYALGLRGPALSVDTACSSSLVSILLACRSLTSGETDLALAGGATVMSGPGMLVDFSGQGALSADGRCKAFAADADGFGMAEGAAVLTLERLSDARRHGHPVLAVVRGGATNQDGASNGLSAPNGRAQHQVIEQALGDCGLRPEDVDVVEAHGTGTRLGDPVEAGALGRAYGRHRDERRPLRLGSVKSNIGHAQAAAGAAGVIKMVLALRHELLPRTLHVSEPAREVAGAGGLRLLVEAEPWPRTDTPRRAGISSFGISGTNAHLIVEEAPREDVAEPTAAPTPAAVVPWVLTGVGRHGLRAQAAALAAHLRERPDVALPDVGRSLVATRAALSHRTVLVPREHGEAVRQLEEIAAGGGEPVRDAGRGDQAPVFVFPGQGWQWPGMGVELLETAPVFAAAMADCDRALAVHTGFSVLAELRRASETGTPDDRVERVQPVLFATMVSLAALWADHGVRPAAVIGHSQGEIAAACVAGILPLDEAARIVAVRARALARVRGGGGMAAVACGPGELDELPVSPAERGLVIAAVNGPRSVVLAGPSAALDAFVTDCTDRGIRAGTLPVDYASHSPAVEPVRSDLLAALGDVPATAAEVPFFSTVRENWLDGPELDAGYWYDNLREPVRFAPAVRALAAHGHRVFLEISAHPVLTAPVEDSAPDVEATALGSLRRDAGGLDEFRTALAGTHAAGVPVTWGEAHHGAGIVDLPTYRYQRRRVWWTPPAGAASTDVADGLRYHVEWHPTRIARSALAGTWLLVRPSGGQPAVAAARTALTGAGAEVRELEIDPIAADRATIRAELRRIGPSGFAGVLSVLAVDDRHEDESLLLPSLAANLALFQAVLDIAAAGERTGRLWCLTTGAVSTAPDDPVPDPRACALWGLGRVTALEHPDLWGGLVDTDAAADLSEVLPGVLAADGAHAEDEVAVRDGRMLARRWVRPGPLNSADAWVPEGTVLVTGGTGGIGRHVVRWLAELGAPHILVASRSGPGAAGELVAEVEALGSAITIAACDVADRDALARLLASVDAELPLTAVFHTAATLDDAMVEHLTAEQLRDASRSKVAGARNLHELTRDADLSAFVLFSSFASAFGAPGLASYAPGNACLDALARTRRGEGLVATSVAWGTWAGAGMATGPVGERFRRHGVVEMRPERALRALRGVLAEPEACPVLIDIAWDRLLESFTAQRATRLFELLPESRGRAVADRTRANPADVGELVRRHAAEVLGHDDPARMPTGRPFRDVGFDSLASVELRNRLSAATGLRLPATVAFDHPDVTALSAHLAELLGESATVASPEDGATAGEPIAIVGMACRFPGGVRTPDGLWEWVLAEADAVGEVPDDRGWDLAELAAGEGRSDPRGAFLDDPAGFDAAFFGISPREALAMDPQQRLALEVAWETLERAGIRPGALRGTDTGVYLGLSHQGYGAGGADPADEVGGYLVTGNTASVASGRISYVLGLEGPALTVDTACSSSLVALHVACGALRAGECSLALAGGVSVMAGDEVFTEFSRLGALAPDGRCKPYAAGADGFGLAEGVGVLALEPLSLARRHGHRVLGIVEGSAVNQDGASNGLTAPNGRAQERVIRQAWRAAGITGDEVDLVEGHGTGTPLGDPVEISALVGTYGRARAESAPVLLGSVKANIGHTQAAAGVAGVIKTVLALRHGVIPPSPVPGGVSELADWDGVELASTERRWEPAGPGSVRRAAVSAFGVSGTNAHVVLREAPADVAAEPTPPGVCEPAGQWPLVLSARSPAALRDTARRLDEHLARHPGISVAELTRTLTATRDRFEYRAVAAVSTMEEAVAALRSAAEGRTEHLAVVGARERRRVVFVFPGQGSQWLGMARELLAEVPEFARALTECDEAIGAVAEYSVLSVLRGEPDAPPWDRVDVVQPVLFAVMVSLARVWRACGVRPSAVVGHSQGEIAAACVAGALSLPEAARVVVLRSRSLLRLSGRGAMLHLPLGPESATDLLAGTGDGGPLDLEIAAINGPSSVVVAGDPASVERAEARCARLGVEPRRIQVDYASHSAHVERVREEFLRSLGPVETGPGEVPLYSTSASRFLAGAELNGEHWYDNLRTTVAFDPAIRALLAEGHDTFLEVSPHPVLTGAVDDIAADEGVTRVMALDTLRRAEGGSRRFLLALARAHAHGLDVDFGAVCGTGGAVELPGYPFEHQRFWLRPSTRRRDELADWFYEVTWERVPDPRAANLAGEWLVILPSGRCGREDADRWARPLRDALAARGARSRTVRADELVGARDVAGVLMLPGLDEDDLVAAAEIARWLDDADSRAPLWLCTSGAVRTGPDDPVRCPSAAQAWGLGMAVALDRGPRWTGLVDLPEHPHDELCARLADVLGGVEDQIALREEGIRARRLVRARRPAPAEPLSPPGGTILITGGTSGIGAVVALRLAELGAEHLVLVSRRGEDAPDAVELANAARRAGSRVSVRACDVTDRSSVAELVGELHAAGERLSGVVHAAGVGQRTPVAKLDAEEFRRVVAPKVRGAWNLHETCGAVELFLLFSSGAGVWGSAEQGAYAAGNAFLDALAEHREHLGLTATSVAWGLWDTGGMTEDRDAVARLRELGLAPMPHRRALDALERVLVHGGTTTVVADVAWADFARGFAAARARPLLTALPEAAVEPEPDTGVESWADRIAELSPPRRRAELLRLVTAEAAGVLGHDDTSAIGTGTTFRALGFDSLAAIRFRNRLHEVTGLRLASTVVFDHPHPESLAEFLDAEIGGTPTTESDVDNAVRVLERALPSLPGAERSEILAKLSQLANAGTRHDTVESSGPADDLDDAGVDELLDALGRELDDN